jgi:hypothetical protein
MKSIGDMIYMSKIDIQNRKQRFFMNLNRSDITNKIFQALLT